MRTLPSGTITCDECSVAYHDQKKKLRWQIQWSDITKIAMWKRDLLVIDEVCIGFLAEGAMHFEGCAEDSQGWDELLTQLFRRYKFKIEDWWTTVVFPPFVENFIVVWQQG